MVEGPQEIALKAIPGHGKTEKPGKANMRRVATQAWSDLACHISEHDSEGGLPVVQNSRASAASFAFVEQMGVRPPSAVGWAMQQETQSEGWLNSVPASEWIYHVADEVYFHLPSSSLWKRIEIDCQDPHAASHTFHRVDAVHVQALSHFAQSMDSALLPFVWAAWVKHTKRRRARVGSSAAAANAEAGKQRETGKAHQVPTEEPRKSQVETSTLELGATAVADTSTQNNAEVFPRGGTNAGGGGTNDMTLVDNFISEDQEMLESPISRPSWFCFRPRRRGSRGKSQGNYRSESSMMSGSTQDSSIKPNALHVSRLSSPSRKSGSSFTDEVGSPGRVSEELTKPSPQVSRVHVPVARSSAARHERTLEQFLSEVKRRPERLIAHVDKRRAEKTHLAYLVVA